MYIDELPDAAVIRRIKARANGRPIYDRGRAVAVVWVSDGSVLPEDVIVRFDVAQREDPARRLNEAMAATGARAIWFFAADEHTREASVALGLALSPVGGLMIRRRHYEGPQNLITLRPRPLTGDVESVLAEHAPAFTDPVAHDAFVGPDRVGYAFAETLGGDWTEVLAVVDPEQRGHGYGAMIAAAQADHLEAAGRLPCAWFEMGTPYTRRSLELAGFRIADYAFSARQPRR